LFAGSVLSGTEVFAGSVISGTEVFSAEGWLVLLLLAFVPRGRLLSYSSDDVIPASTLAEVLRIRG